MKQYGVLWFSGGKSNALLPRHSSGWQVEIWAWQFAACPHLQIILSWRWAWRERLQIRLSISQLAGQLSAKAIANAHLPCALMSSTWDKGDHPDLGLPKSQMVQRTHHGTLINSHPGQLSFARGICAQGTTYNKGLPRGTIPFLLPWSSRILVRLLNTLSLRNAFAEHDDFDGKLDRLVRKVSLTY